MLGAGSWDCIRLASPSQGVRTALDESDCAANVLTTGGVFWRFRSAGRLSQTVLLSLRCD
jgi:hypothetical protein